jgi:hypothetical protein
MDIKSVFNPSVDRGDDVRLSVDNEASVTVDAFIKDGFDRGAIV